MQKITLATPGLSMYIEREQGLLFHHPSQTLYQLPTLSVAITLSLDEGLSELDCVKELSEISLIPVADLHKAYQETYQKITRLLVLPRANINYLDGQYPDIQEYTGSRLLANIAAVNVYQVGNVTFALSTNIGQLEDYLYEILSPLKAVSETIDFHIEICVTADMHYDVSCNQHLIETGITSNQIAPVVIDHMQVLTFQLSDYTFCFHGAGLKNPHGNLFLPGKSGAGKSTLCALLASKGHAVYSDEMIVLNSQFQVQPISLPIALKSGSWALLAEEYPELNTAKVWERLDGRKLKYVWPSSFAKEERALSLIFNPKFSNADDRRDSRQTQYAQQLSVIDSIAMLIEGGYQVGGELTESLLESFIAFIESTQSYSFTYNSSEQAENELARLWGGLNDRA